MRDVLKNGLFILIIVLIIYGIYTLSQKKDIKINKKNDQIAANPNAYLNADPLTNANASRFQQSPHDVDRLPLVEENTTIVPANEIVPMHYKDCNQPILKDQVEKELYTPDAPLFREMGPINLVQLDINDSTHRRINFY